MRHAGNSAKVLWGEAGNTTGSPGDPSSTGDVVKRVGTRWRSFLQEGGCQDPDAVMQAFKKILKTGASQCCAGAGDRSAAVSFKSAAVCCRHEWQRKHRRERRFDSPGVRAGAGRARAAEGNTGEGSRA